MPKKRDATVTPVFLISAVDAALENKIQDQWWKLRVRKFCSREVRHIGEKVEDSTDAESERTGDFERPDRVLDVVQHVVDV